MKTVASEYAKQAYEALGLIPVEKNWMTWREFTPGIRTKCACGLGAIFLYENYKTQEELQTYWENGYDSTGVKPYFIEKGYSDEYISGFVWGFDNSYLTKAGGGSEEYVKGFEDGKNVFLETQYLIPKIKEEE